MGKKGGRGRRLGGRVTGGGRGAIGGGGGCGGGGGFSASGIVDPAVLARHAAIASAAVSASSFSAAPNKACKKSGEESTAKKRKKRKRDEVEGPGKSPERGGKVSSSGVVSGKIRDHGKKKQRNTSGNDNNDGAGEQTQTPRMEHAKESGDGDDDGDGDVFAIHPFGHTRWRRSEQLCRVLLFPPIHLHRAPDSSSSRGGSGIARGASTLALRLVFVSDPDRARGLASTFKPALHSSPSFAVHGRLKRDQLRSAVSQILESPPVSGEASARMGGPALFVADESIDRLLAAVREAQKSLVAKRKKTKSCSDRSFNDIPVVAAHYNAPRSKSVLDLRRRAAVSVARDLGNADRRGGQKYTEIRLDGTQDDIGGNGGSGGSNSWAEVLPNPRSASSLRDHIPPSDRNSTQAVVNAAARMLTSGSAGGNNNPDRKKAAHGKLLAHLAVLRARLEKEGNEHKDSPDGKANEAIKVVSADGGGGEISKKMKILGMIAGDSVHGARKGDREAAMTRWLDGADGRDFGGSWKGPVRTGASAEPATRELAALLDNWRRGDDYSAGRLVSEKRGERESSSSLLCEDCSPHGKGRAWHALRSWQPNPTNGSSLDSALDVSDDDGGGASMTTKDDDRRDFGDCPMAKACGHNETAMFFLSPFAPLEVLNSRVCSRTSPAPGNGGYEGCLEFLRRVCAAAGRGVTYWDAECFAYIDGQAARRRKKVKNGGGRKKGKRNELAPVMKLEKRDLLHLTVDQVSWLIDALRQWTLFRELGGNVGCHPRLLVLGISLVLGLAVHRGRNSGTDDEERCTPPLNSTRKGQTKSNNRRRQNASLANLPPKARLTVMKFILPGDPQRWYSLGSIRLR